MAIFSGLFLKIVGQLLLGLLFAVGAALLAPRQKQETPNELKDFQQPKASADDPVIRVHGSLTIQSPNLILYADKQTQKGSSSSGGKK